MDGNGRWARQRGLPRIEGHRRGVQSVRATVEECCRLGIGQLTLYCLSIENWKRPQHELDFLMTLLHKYLIEERARDHGAEHPLHDHRPARRTCRRRSCAEMDENIRISQNNTGMVLCLAINYGGRTELVDAVRGTRRAGAARYARPRTTSTKRRSATHCTRPACRIPILLIRTAGEMRVSNFLLWQISYAELWVTEKCWPDFDRDCLHSRSARLCEPRTAFRRPKGLEPCCERGCGWGQFWSPWPLACWSSISGLAPWFPFLFVLVLTLSWSVASSCFSFCRRQAAPSPGSAMLAVALVLIVANWPAHICRPRQRRLNRIRGFGSAASLAARRARCISGGNGDCSRCPGESITRIALTVWVAAYLGLLPSFLAQLRWLPADGIGSRRPTSDCRIGAWRFSCPNAATSALTSRAFPRPAPDDAGAQPQEDLGRSRRRIGSVDRSRQSASTAWLGRSRRMSWPPRHSGCTVGLAGILGDLAESLIKRDCRHKDASQVVPGFGGVLDVVDSILFAAPGGLLVVASGRGFKNP